MDGRQQDAGNITRVVTNLYPTSRATISKWSSKETLLMAEMFGNISVTENNGEIGALYVAEAEKLSRVWEEKVVSQSAISFCLH